MNETITTMMAVVMTTMMVSVTLITYIIESIFLAKIASKYDRNPLLAWIPIVNFFLLRDMAEKKSRWQWLLGFLAMAILGSTVVRWIGLQALVWSMMIWYWTAFYTIMEEETDFESWWLFGAVICYPLKLYVMYKMGE